MNPEEIVRVLASFPHRGTATTYEPSVIAILKEILSPYAIREQRFSTPKTYVSVVWWLVGGLAASLLITYLLPFTGMVLSWFFGVLALAYFNWYPSIATAFPPQTLSSNLIVRKDAATDTPQKRILLMAHWDTAPISFLYEPSRVGGFRMSLRISLLLMLLAMLTTTLHAFFPNAYTQWLLAGLTLYFIGQGVLGTMDFFRLGYSNGASDNATGVAAAIATAQNLWEAELPDTSVELIMTGAEEAGMIGAKAYFERYKNTFTPSTYLINFDTLGSGKLKVITETGSLTTISYDNALTRAALEVIEADEALREVSTGSWHTADFDSVWFQRHGIPSVTLAALDTKGQMPNIHRPTDVLANVDFAPMHQAIALATKLAKRL